jgi:SAM-dependent methyltransferase
MNVRYLGSFLPFRFKHYLRTQLRRAAGLSDRDDFLREFYTPWRGRNPQQTAGYTLDPAFDGTQTSHGGLPVPPIELRMGYTFAEEVFLESGRVVANELRSLFNDHGVRLGGGARVLDWGCASGRVLRQFATEAADGEFWGADQDEACIFWCRSQMSPPFRFVTCTAYPHLPFPDHYFDALYAVSVFTHIEYLADTWLMELRRILKPGGVAIVTILDEDSADYFRQENRPECLDDITLINPAGTSDAYILQGINWGLTLPFYRRSHVQKHWGSLVDILEIRPRGIDQYQAAIVFTKKA